jgi:hypothetical protein
VCGLDKSGKGEGQATSCYGHCDEVKGSVNHMAFLA